MNVFTITEYDLEDIYDAQNCVKGAWAALSPGMRQKIVREVMGSLNDFIWDSVTDCLISAVKEVKGES